MRYDTPVKFVKTFAPIRTPDGNYLPGGEESTVRLANVSATGYETLQRIYGEVKEGTTHVRLQHPLNQPFDHIIIDGKKHAVDSAVPSRRRGSYVVVEVSE